jgi:hypothetical protein
MIDLAQNFQTDVDKHITEYEQEEAIGIKLHDDLGSKHIYQELEHKQFWFDNTTFANLSAGMLLFYVALLSNFTGNIAPPPIVRFVKKHRLARQFIGFLVLLYTITLYSPKNTGFTRILGYTVLLWIWFLLTAKQRWRYSFTIFVLLILSYTTLNIVNNMRYNRTLSHKIRKKIVKYCNLFQNISFIIIMILSFMGSAVYFYDEYNEYIKTDNNLWNFLWKYLLLGRKTDTKTVVPTPANITKKL